MPPADRASISHSELDLPRSFQMEAVTRNTSSTVPIIGPGNNQKIRQITFIRPAQMTLFARVTCYPPLGQVTNLQRRKASTSSQVDAVCTSCVFRDIEGSKYMESGDADSYARFDLQSSLNPALLFQQNHGKHRSGITQRAPNGPLFHFRHAIRLMRHY